MNKVVGINGLTDRLGGWVRADEQQGGWDEWVDR